MNEPNEREEFELFYEENKPFSWDDSLFSVWSEAWQHQRKRIETHISINKSLLMQRDTLQAKLNVAVKALEEIRVTHSEDWCNTYALEALAEINKIRE